MLHWLKKALLEIFPFEGYNPAYNTVFGSPIPHSLIDGSEDSTYTRHKFSLFALITSFLNLPNRMRKDGGLSFLSILKNAFFWPEDANASTARKIAGILFGTLILPLRLLSVMTGILTHTLMLATEALPLTLQNLCKEKLGEDSALADVFGIVHFIGRAITSPITGMRAEFSKPGLNGYLLPLLSAAITVVAYGILAPILGLTAFNYAIIHAPQAFSLIPGSVSHHLFLFMTHSTSSLTYFSSPLQQLVTTIAMDAFGLSISEAFFAPILSMLGAATGLFATTIINIYDALISRIVNAMLSPSVPANGDDIQQNVPATTATLITLSKRSIPGGYGIISQNQSVISSEVQTIADGSTNSLASFGSLFAPTHQQPVAQTQHDDTTPLIRFDL